MRVLAIAFLSLFSAGLAIACSSSSSSSDADAGCIPAAGSCDGPAPVFYQVDLQNHCIEPAQITLNAICSTSVNRCGESAGIGPACAFSPDGGVYVQFQSDNNMYSANNWNFDQPYADFPDPGALPADQHASDAQQAQCFAIDCFPYCSGSGPSFANGIDCANDAGGD
jgi:hypothetical protein